MADLRAPTPSAAAELVTPSIASELETLAASLLLRITHFERELTSRTMDVELLVARLDRVGPVTSIPTLHGFVDGSNTRLIELALRQIATSASRIAANRDRLRATIRSSNQRRTGHLAHTSDLLQALSPTETMQRGYAFVEHQESGRPVKSAAGVVEGDRLRTHYLDGAIESAVTSVSMNKP